MREILSTECVYEGRVLKLRVDRVRAPGGQTVNWDVIEHPGSVSIVPIDADDQVLLVRQYRPAIAETLLEIPAGTLEPGESPEISAHRELREEIGMRAEWLRAIGSYYLVPGYSSELMHAYVATGLSPAPLPQDADEDISVESIPFAELVAQVYRGQLRDAKTVSSVLLLARERGADAS
ncbi:MAG: NUDIX hydrolase [Anaerolineales bacterium]|jgi:ADP-ribose pyrophosphatase|nr:NUDIX hydrolase [Anaerolineales bacterium]